MRKEKRLGLLAMLITSVIIFLSHFSVATAQSPKDMLLRVTSPKFTPTPKPTPVCNLAVPCTPPWDKNVPDVWVTILSDDQLTFETRPDFDTTNIEFTWEFGDGTIVDGLSATHKFDAAHSPYITLIISKKDDPDQSPIRTTFFDPSVYSGLLQGLEGGNEPFLYLPKTTWSEANLPVQPESTSALLADQYLQPGKQQASFSYSFGDTRTASDTFFWVTLSQGQENLNVPSSDGTAYVVQANDWLSKLAEKEYDYSTDWAAIWLATNAKAVNDDTFSYIVNPNLIEAGQKLWIPSDIEFVPWDPYSKFSE